MNIQIQTPEQYERRLVRQLLNDIETIPCFLDPPEGFPSSWIVMFSAEITWNSSYSSPNFSALLSSANAVSNSFSNDSPLEDNVAYKTL